MLKMMGATQLTLLEPVQNRRDLAQKFGADFCIDPVHEDALARVNDITKGRGYDAVIEVSGAPSAAETALKLAAVRGTVVYVAMFPNTYNLPLNLYTYCYSRELTIKGSLNAPYAFPRAAAILPRLALDDFVDTVFDLDDGPAAFAEHLSGKHPKVVIRCNKGLD
jgi:(R,R)-butanediol dehydrogenase/meso-butanediol dehydrogenase/diacetyl reductase/L-iditol 2-dehydrogenase